MRILHPTDFSDASNAAGRAAAHLAKAWRLPLHLLHVAHLPGVSAGTAAMPFRPSLEELERRRARLEQAASDLRAIGAEVHAELVEGLPDETILERCQSVSAALLVLGPTGDRRRVAFGLGSTAMRLIKTSPVPTLVVRDEASLTSWTQGLRPLRVAVGLDPSRPARLALNWLGSWTAVGPLDVVALHVYDPETLSGASAIEEKQRFLVDDLNRRLGAESRVKGARARLVAGGGYVTPHLLDACAAEQVDLLVIGTHRYSSVDRILRGSTSLDIVAAGTRNVVTVPINAAAAAARTTPRKAERILVPLDFSDAARRALPWACALVAPGGQLQLLHVCTIIEGERPTDMVARARAELDAIDPVKWDRADVQVRREVVVASNVPKEIVRLANDWDSDLICLASHGRSGLSRVLMGSVTEGVLRRSDRPVVAVPARGG
jgi:nucleotide-binding universal stress UspA family protein